jgi:hypothetical protein
LTPALARTLGALVAFAVLLLAGEVSLRVQLPTDIRPYAGDASGPSGPYAPDPALGARYQSAAAFRSFYAKRLAELGPLDLPRPTWLMFGSSFVNMTGALGDTAMARLPGMRMFYLRHSETLPMRAAQARVLLEEGLRPERIFFVLTPSESLYLWDNPITQTSVNTQGAITKRMRLPPFPASLIVEHSRLAMTGWVRSGLASIEPKMRRRRVHDAPTQRWKDDLRAIFGSLAETAKRHAIPATVVIIPDRNQVRGRQHFQIQAVMMEACRSAGLDCFDAREPFLAAGDKEALFIPDGHLSDGGNVLLLDAMLAHLRGIGAKSAALGAAQ